MDEQEPKKWRYSTWTGIMYGRIPVGLIIVGILFVILVVFRILTK